MACGPFGQLWTRGQVSFTPLFTAVAFPSSYQPEEGRTAMVSLQTWKLRLRPVT